MNQLLVRREAVCQILFEPPQHLALRMNLLPQSIGGGGVGAAELSGQTQVQRGQRIDAVLVGSRQPGLVRRARPSRHSGFDRARGA
jgi:hypothetical protein